MGKLVSIVIPAYNAEKTIERALNSLRCQSYTDIQIVVVNDGSIDRTANICEEIAAQDERVRLLTIKNNGVSNARNIGIQNCSGSYLAFMDSDDYADSNFIANMVGIVEKDVDLIAEGYQVVNQEGLYLFKQKLKQGIYENNHRYLAIECLQNHKAFNALWNKLFRIDIIKKYNVKMDTNLSMGEDFLFIIDYLRYTTGKIMFLDKEDYYYTLSSNGLQASFGKAVELRLAQVTKLKKFYIEKKFPLKGLYLEYLRVFYTAILESSEKEQTIDIIIKSEIFLEIANQKIECGLKYTIFLAILKTHNIYLVLLMIKLFERFKIISKKSYTWQ